MKKWSWTQTLMLQLWFLFDTNLLKRGLESSNFLSQRWCSNVLHELNGQCPFTLELASFCFSCINRENFERTRSMNEGTLVRLRNILENRGYETIETMCCAYIRRPQKLSGTFGKIEVRFFTRHRNVSSASAADASNYHGLSLDPIENFQRVRRLGKDAHFMWSMKWTWKLLKLSDAFIGTHWC